MTDFHVPEADRWWIRKGERLVKPKEEESADKPGKVPTWAVVLFVLLFPIALPFLPAIGVFVAGKPALAWIERNIKDPGPRSFWGAPKAEAFWAMLDRHGCYILHGSQGTGKSMALVLIGLFMGWKQLRDLDKKGDTDTEVFVFYNYTVREYFCRLLLVLAGCPLSYVKRLRIEQYSIMDLSEPTHFHVWRRRHCVIVADELGYYMEEDKKTVKTVLLRGFRMARRRGQYIIGANQELLHSRYRPLFHRRGHCSMGMGRMVITWRGAQDIVDSKKPTKPLGKTVYGLDKRRIGKCYDTWEDLEDLDDDEAPVRATNRRAA